MGKFWDVSSKVLASAVWESIKSNLPGVTVSALLLGFVSWLQGASWLILIPVLIVLGAGVNWLTLKIFRGKKLVQNGVEFFPDRAAMEARFPLSTIFTGNNEIYGHFLSGEGIFSKHPGAYRYVKKLILANPHCGLTKNAQRLAMNDHQDTPLDITKVTNNATAKTIPVRWFDHALGMGFLFCNPDSDDGWVHIELAIPYLEASQKLGIRIEKSKNPEVFKRLYAAFNDTWDDSNEPDKVYFS